MTEIWDEHESVFHYTNQHGLEGILRSQSLHATHYKSLNDASEIIAFRDHLHKHIQLPLRSEIRVFADNLSRLKKVVEETGLETITEREAKTIVDILYRVTFGIGRDDSFVEPYIVSFCGHKENEQVVNGLLSQWRSYGRGGGYAVVFDTKKLCAQLKADGDNYFSGALNFGDVVYSSETNRIESEFAELYREVVRSSAAIWAGDRPDMRELYGLFVSAATRFKHESFREEGEVRIVHSPLPLERDNGLRPVRTGGIRTACP